MKVELRPIDTIKPYDQNPRRNDAAVDAVARSIQEYQFRQPIVVDEDGVIVVGHTRWKAAVKLGMKEVPVHVARLTPEQAKAYRLADNATANIAEWDDDLLAKELADLKALDVDITALGFDDAELAALLDRGTPVGATDPDEVPEPPETPITQPGDLWVLGNHRLLCGDSGKPEDVDRLLAGAPVHLAHMDPPYNVNVEPASGGADTGGQRPGKRPKASWRSAEHQAAMGIRPPPATKRKTMVKGRRLMGDFVPPDQFAAHLLAWFGNVARVLEPGCGFYFWGGYANIANYPPALDAAGLYMSQCLIWHKQWPVITRKDYMGDHEWCFYGWREGAAHRFFGPSNATDLWSVKKVSPQAMIHLTEKPVELATRAIEYSSKPGENVLDLFGGSGSTLIAAEMAGRRAFLMEIDPLYADVIVKRWEGFTRKQAQRIPVNTPDSETPPAAAEGGRSAA